MTAPAEVRERRTARDKTSADTLDHAAEVFMSMRGRLFAAAYRVLGSVAEADDALQEVWVRWQNSDRSRVLTAYLISTTTRLAINVAQSARARHEIPAEPWQCPAVVGSVGDPEARAERAEQLEFAVGRLLQRLTPRQRAAFVLREAFGYSYDEITAMLGVSRVNARQLVNRARKRLRAEPVGSTPAAGTAGFLEAFVVAARTGSFAALERTLAEGTDGHSGDGDRDGDRDGVGA
ncbi:sigma-70 family RNA polymerase sigma factor [Streptomyces albogriseolus]|uniref:sigma-70 family RNA polymerase sigma factor n=1 Tax=Streptomyces albogriseolus TaxID=1887 RepID=UPI0037B971E5